MRLLVTGGAGFIGPNVVHTTLRDHPEHEVAVFDSLTYAANPASLRGTDVELIEADLRDAAAVDAAVARFDAVVHFAAESHVDNSLSGPGAFVESNIIGTFNVLQAVRAHQKRLHHISTDEVFGDLALDATDTFTESTRYNPSSPYAASKASADLLVRAWVRSFDIQATISNCANNYGPYQHVEKLIPRQITGVAQGLRPKVYGHGENVREWTHVEDHNEAVHLILDRGLNGETYLIGSSDERSNKDIVALILELMGKSPDDFDFVPDRPGHDLRYANNTTRIRTELGWTPKHADFREGLAATIDWYLDNQWWWEAAKLDAEAKYAVLGR